VNDIASHDVARDWRGLNLAQGGRSLIEASAGTGKTWTISVLYLRLLLEQGLSPRQIVVATFTNAAAEELRERLRARLLWAESRARSDHAATIDATRTDEAWLHARWQADPACKAKDLQRLRVAIAELDMAPITTLHGLCQRILSDHPFAAGVPFKGGDLVSIDALVGDLGKDLLRRFHQGDEATDSLIRLQRDAGVELKQDGLAKRLKLLLMPGSVVHCLDDGEIAGLLPHEWSGRLRELCANDGYFNKACSLRKYWTELADIIDDPNRALPTRNTDKGLAKAGKLTDISATGKKSAEIAAAAVFSEAVAQSGIIEYLRMHKTRKFWAAIADWSRAQVKSRLSNLNQRTFDDLLRTVSESLNGKEGRSLADALFAAWPVALVDEFQDTDGVQYGILDRIYRGVDDGKRGRLVMIGDPKQAIYRFRGGDIHAYLRAARVADADGRLTLDTNRRSSRNFVAALNQFFAVAGQRLGAEPGDDVIACKPVESSDRQDGSPYTIDGQPCEQPLAIHYRATYPESVPARRELALRSCANQIADLLSSGKHRIGGKPVQPSDIAVLLPANHELTALRDLLRERGVPSVTTARSSVFDTDIARELQVILHAVANCSDLRSMRAAVATRLWGIDYATLRQMSDEPTAWQFIADLFHDWRQRWHQRGVQAVVDALIERVARDQLAIVSGERALTDLRHLGELLQTQSETTDGIIELLAWFNAQRESQGADSDEAADNRQLRIESDAQRVKLMTLHASKGLEFPIVFLPLMWNYGEKDGIGLYQVAADDGTRAIELTEAAKQAELLALQDERFRILYVALTRAIHACHVYALPVDRPASAKKGAAPAAGTARSALDAMLARMQPSICTQELGYATPQIRWIDGWHPDQAIQPAAIEMDNATRREARMPLPMANTPLPAKHSFTTLTRGARNGELAPDASAGDESDDDGVAQVNVETPTSFTAPEATHAAESDPILFELSQVKGKDFGNAVHAIFEHRRPRVAFAEQTELVHRQLAEYNVRCSDDMDQGSLANALIRRLQAVLDTPLGAAHGAGPRLADMDAADMRTEMEFYFAIDGVSIQALRAASAANGEPDLVPSGNRTLAGLMNGKIDLVFKHDGRFHVLDYKGNHLGDRIDDYRGDALAARMDASDYRFQALIYVVALDRYLRQRIRGYDRNKHLGDCYYIFIRAVGIGDGAGIWRHRFSDGLLDAVQKALASARKLGEAA